MNHQSFFSRRRFVTGVLSVIAVVVFNKSILAAPMPKIVAYRNSGCSCCEKWAEKLRAAGFDVEMNDDDDLSSRREKAGVPDDLAGCHTAFMGDYIIEGHAPLADILRVLNEKPSILGIAVPDMPVGSFGMEMGDMRDAYDVVAFAIDGTQSIFAKYVANP